MDSPLWWPQEWRLAVLHALLAIRRDSPAAATGYLQSLKPLRFGSALVHCCLFTRKGVRPNSGLCAEGKPSYLMQLVRAMRTGQYVGWQAAPTYFDTVSLLYGLNYMHINGTCKAMPVDPYDAIECPESGTVKVIFCCGCCCVFEQIEPTC
jgi:hypothetical protein